MKKVCVITEHIPGPATKHGVFNRLGTFLAAFKESFVIDFVFYIWPNNERRDEDLRKYIKEIWHVEANDIIQAPIRVKQQGDELWTDYIIPAVNIKQNPTYFKLSGVEQVAALDNYLTEHQPDLVFAHRLSAMCTVLQCRTKLPSVWFDLDDIEHVAFMRKVKSPPVWLRKYLLLLQVPALMGLERRAIKLASKTFVCSDKDEKYLSRLNQTQHVFSIANSISVPDKVTIPGTEQSILFLGAYSYKPNIDAAEVLVTKLWPKVLLKLPNAKLYIAGGAHEKIPCYSEQHKSVYFLGFVDDLEQLYAQVQVVCCPIYAAGGTRVKIIEAGAYGKAIVATEIAAEGLDFVAGDEIAIDNSIDGLANTCVALLENPTKLVDMGTAIRKKVIQDYDKQSVIKGIRDHYISQVD